MVWMPTKALGASSPASDRERVGSSWSEGVIISRAHGVGWMGGRGEGQRNHRTHPSGRSPEAPSRVSIRNENGQWLPCRHSDVGCLFTSYDFLHNDRQGKRLASLSSTYSPSHPSPPAVCSAGGCTYAVGCQEVRGRRTRRPWCPSDRVMCEREMRMRELLSERARSLPYSLPISLALVNREIELPRRRRQPTRAARLPSTITRLRREAAGLTRIFWNENRKPTAATIAGSVQQNIVLVRLLDTLPRLDSVMENSYSI